MTSSEPHEEVVPVAADAAGTTDLEIAAANIEAAASVTEGHASSEFVLRLPEFEGPLDLLLHLIEREDLDVTAVSLLAVTEQYLAQLRSAEAMSIGALADFIAVGARLLLLKSRALLPREHQPEDAASEDEEADPEALVAALQEYRRYKHAAEHLRAIEDEGRAAYRREAPPPSMPLPTGLDRVTLDSLVELFRAVLQRLPPEDTRPTVQRDPIRLRDRMRRLVERLEGLERAEAGARLSFRAMVEEASSRVEVVMDFLAVLELIKARYLEATQSEAFADIELAHVEGARSPLDGDDLATTFDQLEAPLDAALEAFEEPRDLTEASQATLDAGRGGS